MQLKKIILNTLAALSLTSCAAYASFEVEPLKLHIILERKAALLDIFNRDQTQTFFLELKETGSKKPSTDLLFSPASFTLKPHKKQIVRVTTKAGVDYKDKNYFLSIKTDIDPLKDGKTIGYKIPISVIVNSPKADDLETYAKSVPDISNEGVNKTNDLTQIKIAIPVTAEVK